MSAARVIERLDSMFDLVEEDDLEGVMSIVTEIGHPDIVFSSGLETALDGRPYEGHDGLRTYFTEMLKTVSVTYTERTYERVTPTVVLFTCTAELRGRGSGAGPSQPIGQVIELEDGLVRRATSFTSQDEARRAVRELAA